MCENKAFTSSPTRCIFSHIFKWKLLIWRATWLDLNKWKLNSRTKAFKLGSQLPLLGRKATATKNCWMFYRYKLLHFQTTNQQKREEFRRWTTGDRTDGQRSGQVSPLYPQCCGDKGTFPDFKREEWSWELCRCYRNVQGWKQLNFTRSKTRVFTTTSHTGREAEKSCETVIPWSLYCKVWCEKVGKHFKSCRFCRKKTKPRG